MILVITECCRLCSEVECELLTVACTHARVDLATDVCKQVPGLIKDLYFVLFHMEIFFYEHSYVIVSCTLAANEVPVL
jgi:hypothetical protein